VAYDEQLAHRLRELLAQEDGLGERAMFGGLAFLLDGNMCVSAYSRGGLLARVDPDEGKRLCERPHVQLMEMRGRSMPGWLFVDADAVRTKRQLEPWVRRSVTYVRGLPPKG
jgi:hypothetical protein